MTGYRCPSCGQRYNGKRCRNCLYEPFYEEVAHGLHTHRGEPLVIDQPVRKPIPRKNPFGCPPERRTPAAKNRNRSAREKPKKSGLLSLISVLVVLLALAEPMYEGITQAMDTFSQWQQDEPDATMPQTGTVLYDDGQVLVMAAWQGGQPYPEDFPVVMRNQTDQELCLSGTELVVNGYAMSTGPVYCRVKSGHTGMNTFYLDQQELENAGIETIQEISFRMDIYDPNSFDSYLYSDPVTIRGDQPDYVQPDADQGAELFNQDGVRIVYRGYLPDSYDPEDVSGGSLLFYIENNTGMDITVYTQQAQVNASPADLFLWSRLPKDTRTVASVYLFSLEDLDIRQWDAVSQICFQLEITADQDPEWLITTGDLALPLEVGP